ncbi:hypothetical protein RFI_28867 [Reticulomyxa filosa]|uniref:Ubiquitin-like domain-containing protein n=1 Tax=Reticulomyxa filosa TaxID=46433 RepID=X6M662_RETFI|nr:hypothetical protein RFI_28867 [Reticulomyxa filosa]|eukprot:ETO08520.1 hypothetical protein RFI_28867 [Reticulomyxa filosa]
MNLYSSLSQLIMYLFFFYADYIEHVTWVLLINPTQQSKNSKNKKEIFIYYTESNLTYSILKTLKSKYMEKSNKTQNKLKIAKKIFDSGIYMFSFFCNILKICNNLLKNRRDCIHNQIKLAEKTCFMSKFNYLSLHFSLFQKKFEMKIVVRTQTNRTYSVEVSASATVKNLKEEIEKVDETKVARQKLFLNKSAETKELEDTKQSTDKKELEDEKTLEDYNIKEGDEILLEIPVRSRNFTAVDVTKSQTKKVGTNSYLVLEIELWLWLWWDLQKHEMGLGEIDPNDDHHLKIIKCPGCKERFIPDAYFFYKCIATIKYKTKNDNEIVSLPVIRVEGDYYKQLGGENMAKVEYEFLKLHVAPLH